MEDLNDNLIVTVGPAVEPLSTDEAKLHLRETGDEQDTLIASLVKAARQKIEIETSRCLCTQTLALKLDRFPRCGIELRRPPVQSVTSITYVDTNGETQTLSTDVYRLIQDEPARVELKYGQSWPATRCEPEAVTVNFIAGFGGAAEVPELAKAAMRLILGHWFEHREEGSEVTLTEIPAGAKSIISLLSWGAYR